MWEVENRIVDEYNNNTNNNLQASSSWILALIKDIPQCPRFSSKKYSIIIFVNLT
jgi:hypothetical protein